MKAMGTSSMCMLRHTLSFNVLLHSDYMCTLFHWHFARSLGCPCPLSLFFVQVCGGFSVGWAQLTVLSRTLEDD